MQRIRPMIADNFVFAGVFLLMVLLFPGQVFAQGSIFGEVTNADASVPGQGEVVFFGYLDDTDEEIRIETSVGAGYDVGHWFDDFQNYLTEAPGNPYDYHFYNTANSQGFILSKLIPNNSFQQEDVILAPVSWPEPPSGFNARVVSASEVELSWSITESITCRIYRRDGSSEGSFFRIDDPAGTPSNPGIADTFYIDNTVTDSGVYDYLIIARDPGGNLGPHSVIITVAPADSLWIPGDANADGLVNIGDCVYTINFIFREGPGPIPYDAGNANCDIMVDIGDVVYTINYIFRDGPPPCRP